MENILLAIILQLMNLVNILLDIVLPLVNAGEYFVGYFLAISDAGDYFVGYCFAIGESWRIFCWLLSCHLLILENILLSIVLPLVNADEYSGCLCQTISEGWVIFVGYSIVISEGWRIFCWLLFCH